MKGFIALTSVLILSAVALLLVISGSVGSYYARRNLLEVEAKTQSEALLESCREVVKLKVTTSADYGGGESITVGEGTCDIGEVETHGSLSTVTLSAALASTVSVLEYSYTQ